MTQDRQSLQFYQMVQVPLYTLQNKYQYCADLLHVLPSQCLMRQFEPVMVLYDQQHNLRLVF